MHGISARRNTTSSVGSRAIKLGLLATVATPALLFSATGLASAAPSTSGPYPPVMRCSTGSNGTSGSTGANASCAISPAMVTNNPPAERTKQGGLAYTGSDVLVPTLLAGGLIAGGAVVTVAARRRRAE